MLRFSIQDMPAGDYRITDNETDSRVGTCYDRENAEHICNALNAYHNNRSRPDYGTGLLARIVALEKRAEGNEACTQILENQCDEIVKVYDNRTNTALARINNLDAQLRELRDRRSLFVSIPGGTLALDSLIDGVHVRINLLRDAFHNGLRPRIEMLEAAVFEPRRGDNAPLKNRSGAPRL